MTKAPSTISDHLGRKCLRSTTIMCSVTRPYKRYGQDATWSCLAFLWSRGTTTQDHQTRNSSLWSGWLDVLTWFAPADDAGTGSGRSTSIDVSGSTSRIVTICGLDNCWLLTAYQQMTEAPSTISDQRGRKRLRSTTIGCSVTGPYKQWWAGLAKMDRDRDRDWDY